MSPIRHPVFFTPGAQSGAPMCRMKSVIARNASLIVGDNKIRVGIKAEFTDMKTWTERLVTQPSYVYGCAGSFLA